MRYLLDFLSSPICESKIYALIKCGEDEAKILRYLSKIYVEGAASISVYDMLCAVFGVKDNAHLAHLAQVRTLLDYGWIMQNYNIFKANEGSPKSAQTGLLSLLHAEISLSQQFLKILEEGNVNIDLPAVAP